MKFSVIIPNYNSEKTIERCLDSIYNQTFADYEVIIIDDISTDKSVDIIKSKLRKQDTIIINESKRLNGGSRNVGILKAKGDYIIFIDDDDWFESNTIFYDINNALQDDVDVLFLGYKCYINKDTICPYIPEHKSMKDGVIHDICAPWTKVIKTSIWKKCLFPEGTLLEDKQQHMKILQHCKTFKNFDKCVVVWDRTLKTHASRQDTYWTYKFNYMGDIARLLFETEDEEIKTYLKQSLKQNLNECYERVNKL